MVDTLPWEAYEAYKLTRHARSEISFVGREFIIYQMDGDQPQVLDKLVCTGFTFDSVKGTSATFQSRETGKTLTVGYQPEQVFEYPVFIFLPLYNYIKWEPWRPSQVNFQLVIRTQSRKRMWERYVIYFETSIDFSREFNEATVN